MPHNKIIIVGNLGQDPELKYTAQQTAVVNISVATSEKKKDKSGEWQSVTTWFKVTLWGKQAENASKYLSKGSPVYIEGSLSMEEWTDRDGNKRSSLVVNGTDMKFLPSGGGNRTEKADTEFSDEDAVAPKAAAAAAGDDLGF